MKIGGHHTLSLTQISFLVLGPKATPRRMTSPPRPPKGHTNKLQGWGGWGSLPQPVWLDHLALRIKTHRSTTSNGMADFHIVSPYFHSEIRGGSGEMRGEGREIRSGYQVVKAAITGLTFEPQWFSDYGTGRGGPVSL